jgi:hypothetical protein
MDEERKDRRLCCECVGEAFLQSEIQRRGLEAECSYCGGRHKTFSIGEMADEVELALNEHFYRTATEPSGLEYAMLKEGDSDWERKGDPITFIIEEHAEIELEPAEDIQKVLEERNHHFDTDAIGEEEPFDEDAHYAESGVDVAESQAGWFHFEKSLKTQARYFSRTAESMLTSVFDGIADHKTRDGHPVIVEAGPDKKLAAIYRARVFQSDKKLEEALRRPDRDIGPPPSLAAVAGRMNAHGISVFYGATDPKIALAEVRPPVGSKVVVARFELLRPVRLLDVEALRSVNITGSVFDRSYLPRLERAKFLGWLSRRITMPVMPDDEPFEYLATQAVADFLATNANPPLDGILYPSVQGGRGELNVVLFHKAARVQSLDIPEGTKIDAQLYEQNDEGFEMYPSVWEQVPPQTTTPEEAPVQLEPEGLLVSEALDLPDPEDYDYERREPMLKPDISNVQVHAVKGVEFQTESHPVHRHRIEVHKSSEF